MTLEEIRRKLSSGELTPSQQDVIARGMLKNSNTAEIEYSVHCGWDILKAHACDREWGGFNIKLLAYIEGKSADDALRDKMLSESSLEDYHWNWFGKSIVYGSEEYLWFFLYAEGLPQAASLIYHPKKSVLSSGNIFYVEYIAVAPWNRRNLIQDRVFSGIGARMLKHAIEHCRDKLNLMPGFSLHALPGAMSFYERIGMLRDERMDKGPLAYYEMPADALTAFAP